MSLLSHFESRAEREWSRSIVLGWPTDPAPPPVPVLRRRRIEGDGAGRVVGAIARSVGRTLLSTRVSAEELGRLEEALDESVVVWTPAICLRSRSDVIGALTDADDALGEVVVTFGATAGTDSSAFVEWVATGRFNRPVLLHDDELVEPTGAVVRVGGALCVTFADGRRASEIWCYYDRLGLIEQLLQCPE